MQHSLLTPQFTKLTAAQFFYWLGLNIFMPVIPLHYHSMGMNDFEIGAIVGTISVFGMLFRVAAGKSVNSFGAVPVIALGLILTFCGASGHFFAQSLEIALLSATFQGMGLAFYASAALVLTSFMFEEKYIIDVFAVFTMAGIFGSSLGLCSANFIYDIGGIKYVVGIGLVAVTISIVLFPKHPVTVFKPKKSDAPSLRSIVVNPKVHIPTFSIFITNLSFSATMTFLPLLMLSRGIEQFKIFFISYGISVILFRIMIVRLCHSFQLRHIETVAVAAAGTAMLAITFAEGWPLLILGGFFLGLSIGIGFPAMGATISENTTIAERSLALSFFTSFADLGFVAGAAGLSVIAAYFNYGTAFLLAGLIGIFYTLVHRFYFSKKLIREVNKDGQICS